jgi:signal transduction histidine kinase
MLHLKAWNRSFVELLGLPVKLLTPHVSFERIFNTLLSANFSVEGISAERIESWLVNPSSHDLNDAEIVRSDGVILSISSKSIPDGSFVATFTDVTKERQAKLALQESNETLEQRVEERTAELRREVEERRAIEAELLQAKEAAEEANKGKTRFLAAASHDLLQPLNASRIFLSLLQETELSARQGRYVANADQAFASVEQLLESLLDISRFETRSVQTNISDFPLDEIVQTLVAEFQPVSEKKSIELRHVPSSCWVRSDQALLRRIVQNLLSNAIRYTQNGGVLIGARIKADTIVIEVWDTGPGIPSEKRHQVFEEFRRLHPASGTEPKAMGLGLAIVDRIAKLLGHTVGVRSQIGKGSCFSVEVKRVASMARPAMQTHAPIQTSPHLPRSKTVLIVENDLQILSGMVELLEARNFSVIPTVSSEEALEALETMESMPSLILADYHLDHGTGLEAVRGVRRACGKDIPAIMITADHTTALRAQLAAEKILFIGKPLRPARLFETLAVMP